MRQKLTCAGVTGNRVPLSRRSLCVAWLTAIRFPFARRSRRLALRRKPCTRTVRRRSDSTSDPVEFASASRELEACLPFQALPAFAEWFVYGLEQRDLVSHSFRVTDVWITNKGRWLLEALERIDLREP